MVKTPEMMRTEIKCDLRGGSGEIPTLHLLEADETMGKCNLCSHMTLQPGVSIGEHPHNPDAEIYYCLKGELTVSDNGAEKVMHAGDIMFTGGGQTHWAKNLSNEPVEMLAIVIK